jgi:hypothetical protein
MSAQKIGGPMVFFQPTLTLFATDPRKEKPNGDLEIRAGLDIRNHFLTNENKQSVPEVSVDALSVGPMVEGIYHFSRGFGLGANFHFSRMGLMSDNADVGAPFTATLKWGEDWMWNPGLQGFLTFWDGNLRALVNYDATAGSFEIDTGPGNPALQTSMEPIFGFGIAFDPIGIARSISEGSSSGDKEKKSK